jgi:hypothetical protein
MEQNTFRIKAYGFQELAICYAPELTPRSATQRLLHWVMMSGELYAALQRVGWCKGKRTLTPLQVQVLVNYLGEP